MAKTKKRKGPSTKSTKRGKPNGAMRRGPRSQPLPGMENVRAGALDNLCEGIGDCRDTMNVASVEEKKLIASALKQMQKRNLSVYRHARVELARVPGAEKLRVRVTKEEGDASVEAGAEQTGDESVEVETDDPGHPEAGAEA